MAGLFSTFIFAWHGCAGGLCISLLSFLVACREEIQLVREHHPYEKEFVVESRPTGRERELPNTQPVDLLESTLREVDRSIPDVCEGAPVSIFETQVGLEGTPSL